MMRRWILLLLALFLAPPAFSAEKPLTAELEQVLDRHHIPSVAACILLRDETGVWRPAWTGALGDAVALWPRVGATTETVYPFCSLTKTFTAACVLQLAEEGLVNLDVPAGAFLGFDLRNPWIRDAGPITIRQLLAHRSGLPETPVSFFSEYGNLIKREFGVFGDMDELASYLNRRDAWDHGGGRFCRPDECFAYSNVGYLILGEIIARVTGDTWAARVRSRILEPLGMNRTAFSWHEAAGLKARGYVEREYRPDENGRLVPPAQPLRNPTLGVLYTAGGSAGCMVGTIGDLARWLVVQVNDGRGCLPGEGRPRKVPILSPESLRLMHACRPVPPPQSPALTTVTGYGLGWACLRLIDPRTSRGKAVQGHTGAMPGYTAGMLRLGDDTAVAYLYNEGFSEEVRDERLLDPGRFAGDTALRHDHVKLSEVQHALMKMAARLKQDFLGKPFFQKGFPQTPSQKL